MALEFLWYLDLVYRTFSTGRFSVIFGTFWHWPVGTQSMFGVEGFAG